MGLGDSKLQYQQSIQQLSQPTLPSQKLEFWSRFWTLPNSATEIFNVVKPEDIRLIKRVAPHNLATLLTKIVDEMRRVLAKGAFASSSDHRNVTNCVRLIIRILPFIMEDQSDDFLESVFWRNEMPARKIPKDNDAKNGDHKTEESESKKEQDHHPETENDKNEEKDRENEDKEEDEGDEEISVESKKEEEKELIFEDSGDPLAFRLLNAVVNLLFCPNYTVSVGSKREENRPTTLPLDRTWAKGVGISEVLPSSSFMDTNRCEVLKCMLVLFSEALYRAPEETDKYINKWLDIVACMTGYHSLALFYSLINASCSYDPIGWGMPYNHYIFNDYKEGLAETSLQVLCVLLNHSPSPLTARDSEGRRAKNIFVEYLRSINKQEDFQFIYSAIRQMLNNPLAAVNTYLPNSTKMISCHQEMLMFFWKLIQENSQFFRWLLTKADVTQVVDPILHFLHEGRKDTTQNGLIHLGTFILLFMSGEREFGVQLNKPFTRALTIQLPMFTGNFADYLILVFHKLLVDGHERLDSLYECLLTILANISPYIKTLSMVTSIKLMNLFKLLSRPKFLFASERNHRYVFFLLELFNNCIQYQYEGNYRLVYAMIRDKEAFSNLATLTLDARNRKTKKSEASAEAITEVAEKVERLSTEDEPENKVLPPSETNGTVVSNALPQVNDATPLSAQNGHGATPRTKPKSIGNILQSDFVPTEEWLLSWRNQLPITTIVRLLAAVVPQIPTLVNGSSADEGTILEYLKNTTLVGLLPVPHPILIRRYQNNAATNMWFSTFMWGVIYLRNHAPPIFYGTNVQLFIIKMVDNSE